MDFNDSFTERVHQRNRERKEFLNSKRGEILSVGQKRGVLTDEHQFNSDEPPSKSPKRSSSFALQATSGKENIQIQNEDSNSFVPIHTASNSRGLSALRRNASNDEDDNTCFKPPDEHLSSEAKTYVFSTNTKELCSGKSSRMANLAANIRQWEDELPKPLISTKSVAPSAIATNPASQNTFSMKLVYTERKSDSKEILDKDLSTSSMHTESKMCVSNDRKIDCVKLKSSPKKLLDWNAAIAATLETTSLVVPSSKHEDTKNGGSLKKYLAPNPQQRCSDESMDENDFAENYNIMSNHRGDFKKEMEYSPFKHIEKDQKVTEPPKIEAPAKKVSEVDPAELPLAARRALFEKNLLSGTPKVNEDVCFSMSIAQRAAMFEKASKTNYEKKCKGPVLPKCDKSNDYRTVQTVEKVDPGIVNAVSPVKKISPPHNSAPSPVKKISPPHASAPSSVKKISPPLASTISPTKRIGSHVFLVQQKLAGKLALDNLQDEEFEMEDNEEVSSMSFHSEHSSASIEEGGSEVDHLEEMSSSAVENYSEVRHFENFSSNDRNSDPKISKLEKLSSSSAENNCFGLDPSEKSFSSSVEDHSEMCYSEKYSSCSTQDDSEMCYSEEPPSSSVENNCFKIGHSKTPSSSNSDFDHAKKLSASSVENSSFENSSYGRQSCTSDSSVGSYCAESEGGLENTKEKRSETPLLYTVSFYRKQKQETRLTPVQTIRREKEPSMTESPDIKYTEIIQERIKGLQDEILRQQQVISQTSQALNLCSATLEFSGSTEQVEAERLLLIATQKRQACLNEITRLKTFGAQGENIADDRGTMTISDIILPLKREFVASQLEGKDNDIVHYFLCLIRHGAQVIVSQMVSTDERTSDGTLVFTNHIQLQDLPPTFSVIFEVYALQTKKEVLPHEKKYHIKREHSKIRLTPKSKKNNEKMLLPAVSSPGGPNAVRSPCFGVIGFTRFTLQNCNKRTFTLDKVPFTSPLEGVLRVKLQLHAEHKVMEKGFLTLFDDVGGFGAWLRRWCVLDANNLALWKYPDDEHKKEPAAVINLKQCITGLVKPVARNICARPHTFQLVTVRPQEKGDQPTLVSRSVNTLTTTKHLLSADTKEERIVWCDKLNEALNNVRKWDPQALRPVEGMQV